MRAQLKSGLSALVIATLLTPALVDASRSQAEPAMASARAATSQGQCRHPAALPQLGPERWDQQDYSRRAYPMETTRMGKEMPPPPPAMGAASVASPVEADAPATDVATAEAPGDIAKGVHERATMRPLPWPGPRPRAGVLTAGEHDDLLNPELYAAYARRSNLGQEIPALPSLDTARVLTVEVRDRAGQPIRGAQIEVQCADGNRMQLATLADGTVTLFPGVDRLSQTVRIRAADEEWRTVSIPRGAGGQSVTFALDRMATQAPSKLDLMLAIDTTGSMGDEIAYLQSELAAIIGGIRARHPGIDVRVGFVFYRDTGDDYVTNTVAMSRDVDTAQGVLRQRWAGDGRDYPEAVEQALIRAAGQDWRSDAVKTLLLVGDAPPHDENFGTAWLAAEHLRAQRVQIVPVAASGVADKAEYMMRAMAALTQSRYTFLTDDSGVGNPHAKPAIDCYQVTRLADLLRRVIDSQISGRRIEAGEQEVLRTVGNYDKGRCIIPRGGLQEQ